MRIDFQAVLTEYLFSTKTLTLPGLGTWKLNETSSSLDTVNGHINPPTAEIVFSPKSADNNSLTKYISHKLGLRGQEVQTSFIVWLDQLKQRLKKGKEVSLRDLGTLSSKGKEGIVFAANKDVLKGYPQLPGITARTIERAMTTTEDAIGPINGTSEMKESIIPIFVLTLLILGIAWLISWPGFEKQTLNPNQPQIEKERINLNPEFDTVLASEKDSGSSKNEESIQEGVIESVDSEDSEVPVVSDEVTEEASSEEAITKENEAAVLEQAFGKECVIVLGAFSNLNNSRRLKAQIAKMGYIPYESDHNGLKRIGVSFDCLEKDLYTTLYQLRGKFSKDAWILKYD